MIRVPALRAALLLFAAAALAICSDRIPLNGEWQFRIDESRAGAAQEWPSKIPPGTQTVVVPHTWNIGKHADYEGTAWYFRSFPAPPRIENKHVELQFDATFYRSRVWLNGVELGTHEGGHTAYWFDITPHLRPENVLAVELNNEPGLTTIPGFAMSLRGTDNVWYDWWHYGGIVRDVILRISDPVLLRRQQIRSRAASGAATLTDRIFIENNLRQAVNVRVKVDVLPPGSDTPAATAEQTVMVNPGESNTEITARVDQPRLWYIDRPELYRVRATVLDAYGAWLDSITDNYGFRTIEIRDRKLWLNGERVRLSGMTRHEESPWEGLAETRGTMLHDYTEMKELQVTLTRPVHYPQHPFILDFADRNGILLVPEIPMWQFSETQMQDPRVIALAKQMMTEMIEEAYNHPSILGWSVCNESETNKPGGRRYFETMYEMVKHLDPDRYVSYADAHIAEADPKINAATVADFVMMNQYFGTWGGPAERLIPALDKAGRDYPNKMFFISEFGAAGIFAPDKKAGDELRTRIIREQLPIFRKYDFIAGAIFWCYQDYRSHRNLRPGERSGMVEMGIVDENRQRYPSFYAWQEENSPADVKLGWRYDDVGTPVGFHAVVARRGEDWLPSYTLRGYRAEWQVRDATGAVIATNGQSLADIGPPQTVDVNLPDVRSRGYKLTLRIVRPGGFTAWERTVDWWEGLSGGDSIQDMQKRGIKVP